MEKPTRIVLLGQTQAISLMSLSIAIGMVVDNAIVLIDYILLPIEFSR